MKKFIIFIIIIFLLVILISVFYLNKPFPDTITLKIKNQNFYLQKAITTQEKEKGLMFVENLDNNTGMIFIWSDEQSRVFWMKNTLIPLDIVFLDKNKKIVDIKHNFQPCHEDPCPTYTSKPAMYVIEINEGLAEKLNLTNGERIEFD